MVVRRVLSNRWACCQRFTCLVSGLRTGLRLKQDLSPRE